MRKSFWSLLEILQTIAIAVVVVALIRSFVAQPFLVSGSSMEPVFRNGDYLLIDQLTYRFREPARGEVIVFRGEQGPGSYYIKRVVGLPSEQVRIKENRITVSNSRGERIVLEEPYVRESVSMDDFEITLGDNFYFVLGDNRGFSFDSRSWGALDGRNVVGLVRFRLWPVGDVTVFAAPVYNE